MFNDEVVSVDLECIEQQRSAGNGGATHQKLAAGRATMVG